MMFVPLKHKYLLIGLSVVFMIGRIGCPPVDPKKPSNTKDGNDVSPDDGSVSVSTSVIKMLLLFCTDFFFFFYQGHGC